MRMHTLSTEVSLIIIMCMLFLLLIQLISPASPQDFCDPFDYLLQPGDVLIGTTLVASTPESLNNKVEEFVKNQTKVVKVDRTKFPKKVTVWCIDYIDYIEPDNSITLFEVRW